jgi:hypothetical protein
MLFYIVTICSLFTIVFWDVLPCKMIVDPKTRS